MNNRSKNGAATRRNGSKRAINGKLGRLLVPSILVIIGLVAITAAALFSARTPKANAAPAQAEQGISPEALAQIDALIREKDSRTGVETKMDSQLVYEVKMRNGLPVAEGVLEVATDLEYVNETQGKVELDIRANVSDALLSGLRANGAQIVNSAQGTIRVITSIDSVPTIAGFPDVIFVQPKQKASVSQNYGQVDDTKASRKAERLRNSRAERIFKKYAVSPEFQEKALKIQDQVAAALTTGVQTNVAGTGAPTGRGSRSSEADITHRVNSVRGAFHVDGTGIKIGVLSDGVNGLATAQALGDLPAVTVLPGQAGPATGAEGTAMLELVHDLAPGAQLFFATGFPTITQFAQNIRDLRTAGCDIIVDDLFYFAESPFQDGQAPSVVSPRNQGVVIQAVNDVTAAGALYFSSAGNSGNKDDNTSGTWEGDFVDGGATAAPIPVGSAGNLHNFGGQNFNLMTAASTSAGSPTTLNWSDPLGGSTNDYDLFVLNSTGTTVLGSSTNIQNGTQDPFEIIGQAANTRIVIVRKTGAASRFLNLNTNRGRLSINTNGVTYGHSHAANAFSTAATPAVGPFPGRHSSANVSETFTSDGPRRLFYQADGTPITPGNFLATGGLVRQKPDITAADGASVTGVGNFPTPFFGTSAAAPHAAAIAALLKDANPAFTPAQIRTALTSTAIDIEAPGVDRNTGVGIIDAFAAMQSLGVPGTAFLEFGTITALEAPGDGNALVDPGDGATLAIQLINTGVAPATAISATLTSTTPGIVITLPSSRDYPDLAALGGSGVSAMPFRFSVAGNVTCPATINFTLTVNYAGIAMPQVMHFTVPIGPPAINIASTLDLTAPVAGAGFTTATGIQGARHFRDGIASACGAAKAAFPGTTQPGNRQFDAYTFTTCASSGASCITVTLTGANAINLFTAAYINSFNPANLATNYIADPGSSAAVRTYSFNLPAGQSTFVITVYDVPIGAASNSAYSLNVSGGCIGSCSPHNELPVAKAKNVTVSADASCQANASVDDGSFDPDGDPITITQTPAGPYPLGVTPVLLTVTDPRGGTTQAMANVTVVDDTKPTIATLPDIITAAPVACPFPTGLAITFPLPAAGDNCSTPTVACVPPSNAIFPLGTTTVTCTATDTAGNSNSSTFAVTVFTGCLNDDTVAATTALYNHLTGAYRFYVNGVLTASGTGSLTKSGCTVTIQHNTSTSRVTIRADHSTKSGNATLQKPVGVLKATITDRDLRNNSCTYVTPPTP